METQDLLDLSDHLDHVEILVKLVLKVQKVSLGLEATTAYKVFLEPKAVEDLVVLQAL